MNRRLAEDYQLKILPALVVQPLQYIPFMTQRTDSATILIVDDMPSNLGLVVGLFEDNGYRVAIAQEGEECLQRAMLVQPDLILLDVMMPGLDGFEICRRLKAQECTRDIPVIFMTALTATEHKLKGFEVGGVDYVTKPLQIREAMARVDTHLKLHASQKQLAAQNLELEKHRHEMESRVAERTSALSASNQQLRLEIAERKQVRERLALLDFALNQVGEAAYLVDEQGHFVYVNDEACRILGYPRQTLLTMCIAEIDPEWTQSFWDTFKQKGALRLDTRHSTWEGRLCPVEVNANYFEYEGVGYNLVLAHDISARKLMEDRLRAGEREFRTLAENSPDLIVRYDLDCRRIYFNQACIKTNPKKAMAALGKTPLECWWIMSPSAEEYTHRLQRAINSGEMDDLLMELVDHEGFHAYYTMALVPEFDENNRIVSILTIGRDITGIKRMEAMLRKSELEFRTLAENSPEMIVRYARDCRRIYINPAYERETGIPLEMAWNKTPLEIWKPLLSCEEYMARLGRVMASGEPDRILLEWFGDDGNLVSHDMHAVAEYDEVGQVIGVLVMGHNITELKSTERRLEESRVQLRSLTAKREEAREEERKHIAREIHDELGQLLNVLRLNATTIDFRYGDSHPDLRDKTQKMVGIVDRAILMVRNIATRLRPAVLSSGFVDALEWLVQEYKESSGIDCRLHVSTGDISLDEDRAMVVFRIVQESLTNVLRHSEASRVDITLRSGEGICEVEVRDNGNGFDIDKAGRLNSFGIVGMRERALILKGSLDIDSGNKCGTTLKLSIPIDDRPEFGRVSEHG